MFRWDFPWLLGDEMMRTFPHARSRRRTKQEELGKSEYKYNTIKTLKWMQLLCYVCTWIVLVCLRGLIFVQSKLLFLFLNNIFPFIMNGKDLLPLSSLLSFHLPQTVFPLRIYSCKPDFPVSSSLFVLPAIWAFSELIHSVLECHRVHVLASMLFQH